MEMNKPYLIKVYHEENLDKEKTRECHNEKIVVHPSTDNKSIHMISVSTKLSLSKGKIRLLKNKIGNKNVLVHILEGYSKSLNLYTKFMNFFVFKGLIGKNDSKMFTYFKKTNGKFELYRKAKIFAPKKKSLY